MPPQTERVPHLVQHHLVDRFQVGQPSLAPTARHQHVRHPETKLGEVQVITAEGDGPIPAGGLGPKDRDIGLARRVYEFESRESRAGGVAPGENRLPYRPLDAFRVGKQTLGRRQQEDPQWHGAAPPVKQEGVAPAGEDHVAQVVAFHAARVRGTCLGALRRGATKGRGEEHPNESPAHAEGPGSVDRLGWRRSVETGGSHSTPEVPAGGDAFHSQVIRTLRGLLRAPA